MVSLAKWACATILGGVTVVVAPYSPVDPGLALLAACMLLVVLWVVRRAKYRYDELNPYRRYCLNCGQQQDVIEQGHTVYWESVGAMPDPTCRCHLDTPR